MSHTAIAQQATTTNARLKAWVEEMAALAEPDAIHWCDGSRRSTTRLRRS